MVREEGRKEREQLPLGPIAVELLIGFDERCDEGRSQDLLLHRCLAQPVAPLAGEESVPK
eukprot:scaffold16481_cov93-Phaeocystis_antarctica.AAC.3